MLALILINYKYLDFLFLQFVMICILSIEVVIKVTVKDENYYLQIGFTKEYGYYLLKKREEKVWCYLQLT